MVKYLKFFIFLIFFLNSCEVVNRPLKKYQPLNKLIYVDVIEKKIIEDTYVKSIYSNRTQNLLTQWLENSIKTNGFDGYIEIRILGLNSRENETDSGVIINISAKIELSLFKSALDSKKIIIINGEEYGQLIGDFTLNDKSTEVDNIIKRLIEKFSMKLFKELN